MRGLDGSDRNGNSTARTTEDHGADRGMEAEMGVYFQEPVRNRDERGRGHVGGEEGLLGAEPRKMMFHLVETDRVLIGKWTLDAPFSQKLTWKP